MSEEDIDLSGEQEPTERLERMEAQAEPDLENERGTEFQGESRTVVPDDEGWVGEALEQTRADSEDGS